MTAPRRIEELDVESALNVPQGYDEPGYEDAYLRAAFAFIAQLRDRVDALERQLAQKNTA